MTWNHRVIETQTPEGPWFAVHEVYYRPDGTPSAYTKEPVAVSGDTKDELIKTLVRMRYAIELPTLTPADFGRKGKG